MIKKTSNFSKVFLTIIFLGSITPIFFMPDVQKFLWKQIKTPTILILIIFTIISIAFILNEKYKKNTDEIPIYESPKNTSPLEAGVFINKRFDTQDIVAVIVYLYLNNFIDLVLKENNYVFTTTNKNTHKINFPIAQEIWTRMFYNNHAIAVKKVGPLIPDMLLNVNSKNLPGSKRTTKIRSMCVLVGFLSLLNLLMFPGTFHSFSIITAPITIVFILSLVLVGSRQYFSKTETETRKRIIGYKKYLQTVSIATNKKDILTKTSYLFAFNLAEKLAFIKDEPVPIPSNLEKTPKEQVSFGNLLEIQEQLNK